MSRFRALCSHRFHALPKTPLHSTPILQRAISTSPQFEDQIPENKTQKGKKPLVDLFKEAVGLREKPESESEGEDRELKKRLRELEREVRRLKANAVTESETPKKKKELKKDGVLKEQTKPKTSSLSSLFSNGKNRDGKRGESGSLEKKEDEEEEPVVFKDFSEDMLLFVSHLHREGYFKDANFLPRSGLIYGAFDDSYSRAYIKFAAERFGKDNQEIAQWLSGSDLKKVALFGCPSLSRKSVFAAKRLRTFFRIQEELVCSKCVLKQSCKFVNQSVWKGDTKSLNLSVVMRLLTLYAMESMPPQLVLPDEVKASVGRLLKEVVRLSETVA
ncbi:hypothetical protein PVL29_025207 [Vitis rotundifolia]|uniref:Uncharacterized protein n=1 Tax=Vitis rotundifolia TaxID=103349 RepID=A0AA39D516_VITRO|nr:hypothetical protein PVL29_025207 [Vitis rotundifolia]